MARAPSFLAEETLLHPKNLVMRTVLATAMLLALAPGLQAQELPAESLEDPFRHSIEFSPISTIAKIYALQYAYSVSRNDDLIAGLAYGNVHYPYGTSNAPTVIVGYRRYVWANLHVEYQLWPAYNMFYSTTEQKQYNGLELWNELRAGYRFDYSLFGVPSFVSLQGICGFGLWPGNKPEAFLQNTKSEPLFIYPNIMLGTRF